MDKIYDDGVKKLEGKAVLEILFGDDDGQNYITFKTTDGDFHYYFDGDCCSQSYVTEILGVEQFLDKGTITSVEESDYGGKTVDYDRISRHALRLRCKDGDTYRNPPELLILWENASNGYYDGSIDSVASVPEAAKIISIKENWKKPKEEK